MTTLKLFTVYLRRRGGRTRGRIEVQAAEQSHAERVAKAQLIAVSYPKSKRSQWIFTSVGERSITLAISGSRRRSDAATCSVATNDTEKYGSTKK